MLPDDDDIMRAIAKKPLMMERPILSHDGRAVVGRPPEAILGLLDAPAVSAEDAAKANAALEALSMAVAAAQARGVAAATVERSLLRVAAELSMLN